MVTVAVEDPTITASSGELIDTKNLSSPSRTLSSVICTSEHLLVSGGVRKMVTLSGEKSSPPKKIDLGLITHHSY